MSRTSFAMISAVALTFLVSSATFAGQPQQRQPQLPQAIGAMTAEQTQQFEAMKRQMETQAELSKKQAAQQQQRQEQIKTQ